MKEGAEMSGTGMAIALNRAGFWIRKVGFQASCGLGFRVQGFGVGV